MKSDSHRYSEFRQDIEDFYDDLLYTGEIVDIARQHVLHGLADAFQNEKMLRWHKSEIFSQMQLWGFPVVHSKPKIDLKMYIAVLDDFPDFMVPTLVAHSVLAADRVFAGSDLYDIWFADSFKKVVVRVNQKEFDKISQLSGVYLGHESKTLGGRKACAVVSPRAENPNVLKFANTWKPKQYRDGCDECDAVQTSIEKNRRWHEGIAKGREIIKRLASEE